MQAPEMETKRERRDASEGGRGEKLGLGSKWVSLALQLWKSTTVPSVDGVRRRGGAPRRVVPAEPGLPECRTSAAAAAVGRFAAPLRCVALSSRRRGTAVTDGDATDGGRAGAVEVKNPQRL